jgi:hypothetical protein
MKRKIHMHPIMTIAVISDRDARAGEIVVAASTILTMTYLTVKPVSSDETCRDEFINACRATVRNGTPKKYAARIANPAIVNAEFADFWLAFDKKGEKLARQIVQDYGKSVEDGKYDFPGLVHLFEHTVPDPPEDGDIKPWVRLLAEQLAPWRERIQKMHSENP